MFSSRTKALVLKLSLTLVFVILGGLVGSASVVIQLREQGVEFLSQWIGGCPIVTPWRIITIPKQIAERFPDIISRGYLWFASLSMVGMGLVAALGRSLIKDFPKSTIFGSARWASIADIKKQGLLNATGVFLGQLPNGRYLRHDGPEHYAVVAPTRSGKGAGVVVPTLLNWPGSALVYDLKEENWNITAGKRSEFSRVIYFNPNSRKSARFNPLLEVRKGEHEVRDVQNVADMITDPDGNGYSDHWIKTGHSLLVGTILHLLYAGSKTDQTLGGIARVLSNPSKTIVETLTEMKDFPHLKNDKGESYPHPVVAQAAREMLNKSDNERSGVLSTAMSFLTLYRDPIVAENTSESDFCICDLMDAENPVSLYLVVPPSDINRLRTLVRLMINQICRRLTEEHRPRTRRHRLLLMLDEFPALGRLEFFETALGFIASYGIKAMLVSQSINQIRKVYSERNSLLDNTHVRLFYAPNTIETAEYISKSLGQTTESFSTQSEGGRKGSLWMSNVNVSNHFTARPLLTPGEVMELPPEEAILLLGGSAPTLCRKIRYYQDANFTSLLTDPPALESRSNALNNDIVVNREASDTGGARWLEVIPLDDDFDIPVSTQNEQISVEDSELC